MKKNRTASIVKGVAAAFLAAALLPALVAAQETEEPARPARPRLERMRPLADLALTPEQEKALEAFREARIKENEAFRREMFDLRSEMRALAGDPAANRAKIEALIDKTAGLRAEREKASLRAMAERDKIFTPEQLEKMKDVRGLRGMRGMRGTRGMAGMRGQGRFMGFGSGQGRLAHPRGLRHRPGLGCPIW